MKNKKRIALVLMISLVLLTCVSAQDYQVSETPDYLGNFFSMFMLSPASITFQGYEEYKSTVDYPLPNEVYADTTLDDEIVLMKLYQSSYKILYPTRSKCEAKDDVITQLQKTKVLYPNSHFEFIFSSGLQRCYRLERTYYKKSAIPEPEDWETRVYVCEDGEWDRKSNYGENEYCRWDEHKNVNRCWCSNEDDNFYLDSDGDDHCRSSPLSSWCEAIAPPLHKTQSYICTPDTMTWFQGQRCEEGSTAPSCRWCPDPNHNSYYDYYGKYHCASAPLDSWCIGVSAGTDSAACVIQGGHVHKDCDKIPDELVYDTGFEISNMQGYYCCFVADFPSQAGDVIGKSIGTIIEGATDVVEDIFSGVLPKISWWVWVILGIILLVILWPYIRLLGGLVGI